MAASLECETHEDTPFVYAPAELEKRVIAFILDIILVSLLNYIISIVILVSTLVLGFLTGLFDPEMIQVLKNFDNAGQEKQSEVFLTILPYFIGFIILLFVACQICMVTYFTYYEVETNGQTFGKRTCGLRVVRIDGSPMNLSTSLVRNSIGVIDGIFPLVLVPLLSKRSQRLGDMVAGTMVIADVPEKFREVDQATVDLETGDARFTYELVQLERVRSQDFHAIERVLERWGRLSEIQRNAFLNQLVPPLVERLQATPPALGERARFLKDLLNAEHRRQQTKLPVAVS